MTFTYYNIVDFIAIINIWTCKSQIHKIKLSGSKFLKNNI